MSGFAGASRCVLLSHVVAVRILCPDAPSSVMLGYGCLYVPLDCYPTVYSCYIQLFVIYLIDSVRLLNNVIVQSGILVATLFRYGNMIIESEAGKPLVDTSGDLTSGVQNLFNKCHLPRSHPFYREIINRRRFL